MPTAAVSAPATPPAVAVPQARSADRFIAAIRVALVIALTALVLAIAALAYVVSFEAIRAFAVETAAFPPELAWSAPLLVDSFTTAASLVILWPTCAATPGVTPGTPGRWSPAPPPCRSPSTSRTPRPHQPQLFAALPPVALLGALELLMSVARTGLPHTDRTTATATAEVRSADRSATQAPQQRAQLQSYLPQRPAAAIPHHRSRQRRRRTPRPHPAVVRTLRPQPTPQRRTAATGNGSAPARDSRARVRELLARERATGRRLAAREVAAQVGISERRAYELLRTLRAE